jgi:hypothetical protein
MKLEEKTLELAKQSIGVTEETPNWGRWVSVYLKFVGIFSPAPWCAAFVAYKIHQAAGQLNVKATWPKAGYVQSVVNWAKKKVLVVRVPLPNTVFAVWHPELNRYAHIGFIAAVRKSGSKVEFLSVEGNSNTDGSREGKAVVSQWRTWNDAKYICILIQ